MKIKSVVLGISIIALFDNMPTHCMLMGALKTSIRGIGTLCGASTALWPFVTNSIYDAYIMYQNPAVVFPESLPIGPVEEKFYRQYVDPTVEIRFIPDKKGRERAMSFGSLIIMPETKLTNNGPISLTEALESDNIEVQKIFAGVAEHEYGHIKNKDSLQFATIGMVLPTVITAFAYLRFKKLFPCGNNDSLSRHIGLFFTKLISGQGLHDINKTTIYAVKGYISRPMELAADQNVSRPHRKAFLDNLELMDTKLFNKTARKDYPHLTAQEQREMAEQLRLEYHNSWSATHPTYEARRKALLEDIQNTPE